MVDKVARDNLIDVTRGLALLMIFINHVPGNAFEDFTSRNFGFSDATEIFVFLAGYSAAMVYGRRLGTDGLARAWARAWARAFVIYLAHLSSLLLVVAVVAAAALSQHDPHFLEWINLGPIFHDSPSALLGVALLTHQAGYFNILPLYVVLMLALPGLLLLLRLNWLLCLGLSCVLYLFVQVSGANFPNYPNDGGWFFNPLAWQLIFVIGLVCGDRARHGLPIPRRKPLFLAALVVLVVAAVMKGVEYYPAPGDLPLPFFLFGQEKTFLTVPRLLHALALFYVFVCLEPRRWIAQGGVAVETLAVLGRNGLAVFCVGSVLAIVVQILRFATDPGPVLDVLIMAAGLFLLMGVGWYLNWYGGSEAGRAVAARLPSGLRSSSH